MPSQARLSRRLALQSACGMAVWLPAFSGLRGQVARAATPPPKRLLVVCNVHGTFPERFWPRPRGMPELSPTALPAALYSSGSTALDTTDFTLPPILAPLAKHKSRMMVLEGIDNVDGQEGHRNLGALLTSALPVLGEGGGGRHVAKGKSMDQLLAERAGTPIPSLQLGVKCGELTTSNGCLSWYDTGKPAPAQNSPSAVHKRLFGTAGTDAQALARLRAERKSVLDSTITQASRLRNQLLKEDQVKLDGYLTSFREIEQRLTNGPAELACQAPSMEPQATDVDLPTASQMQMDLAVAALACDRTRVITLQYGHEGTVIRHPWLTGDMPHHTVSHAGNNDLAGYNRIASVQTWYASQVSSLLDKLAAVPEEGGTLLDNTLVLWVNSMTKGNEHHNWNIPCVLAGNVAGRYRMGRYVRFARDASVRYQGRNKFVRGRSMGDLHTTILRTMGVEVDKFGDPYFFNGPLDAQLLQS